MQKRNNETENYHVPVMKEQCQLIEIPMWSDPTPFMGNLFLYYYERK